MNGNPIPMTREMTASIHQHAQARFTHLSELSQCPVRKTAVEPHAPATESGDAKQDDPVSDGRETHCKSAPEQTLDVVVDHRGPDSRIESIASAGPGSGKVDFSDQHTAALWHAECIAYTRKKRTKSTALSAKMMVAMFFSPWN